MSKEIKRLEKRYGEAKNKAEREARAERVRTGTWMGRNCIYRSKTDYNRQKTRLQTKKESAEYL